MAALSTDYSLGIVPSPRALPANRHRGHGAGIGAGAMARGLEDVTAAASSASTAARRGTAMTDRSGPPLALDPFAVLEPAIVVVRAETEAREGLQALLEQVYGLQEPAIHCWTNPSRWSAAACCCRVDRQRCA